MLMKTGDYAVDESWIVDSGDKGDIQTG